MSDLYIQYVDAVKRLPITNPTEADFQSVCPHLTPEQVKAAFTPEADETSASVATPPMRIRHGYLVVNFWQGDAEHEPRLSFYHGNHTLASYADGNPRGEIFHDIAFQDEAMAYAEEHWPERLILDTWESFGQTYVQDPTGLDERGNPKTKFVISWTTSDDFSDAYELNLPRSVAIDRMLSEMTLDELVSSELRGGRGGYTEYNCANCGAGLSLRGCHGCGHSFRDNGSRSGWDVPLTPKMVELLKAAGHTFGVDPEVAWETERKIWEKYRQVKQGDSVHISEKAPNIAKGQTGQITGFTNVDHWAVVRLDEGGESVQVDPIYLDRRRE